MKMISKTSKISHKGTTFGSDFDLLAPISTLMTDLLYENDNLADKKNKVKSKPEKYFSASLRPLVWHLQFKKIYFFGILR
jgi:hypothetical protein